MFLSMITGTYRMFLLVYGPVLPCSPYRPGQKLCLFPKVFPGASDTRGACRPSNLTGVPAMSLPIALTLAAVAYAAAYVAERRGIR